MLFKKIDASSANSITSALGFFETPPSNVGISNSLYRELLTLNPVSDPPFHFKIHPGSNFLDLSHIYLETEMSIQKLDNNVWVPITKDDKIGTIQGIGGTWIRNLKVTINGRESFNANSLYSYKSYIDTELSFDTDVKSSYLGIMGYYPSGPKQFDQNSKNDEGYINRKKCFEAGKTAQFFTKLNSDLFASDLLMINNVPIEIEIHPAPSDFLLLSLDDAPVAGIQPVNTTSYRLNISSCKLYCKFVELMPGLSLEIANQLERMPARYGIRRSELKSVFISQGRYEFQTNLFQEQIPRRIILCFVESAAYNGSIHKSPFNFGHFNIREITVTTGTQTTPSVLYDMDFTTKNSFYRCYNDFCEAVGMANTDATNGISPHHFKNGWAFFSFIMTSDLENSPGFELIKPGTTSINVRFSKAVPAGGINMVCYGEMDSLLLLDKNRTLTSDLTV